MGTTCRKPLLAAAALAAAAVALCACAGPDGRRSEARRGGGTGVVLSSSSWLNGSFGESSGADARVPGGASGIRANKALKPDDPWLGAVGVRSVLGPDCEAGMGVCVPNPFPSANATQPTLAARAREVGLGVWLKLDF